MRAERRSQTENNHSATHLLHAALRGVLGEHVQQKGSLVNDQNLRFDFSHFSKMTEEEIQKVEAIVNDKIRENIPVEIQQNVPIETAKQKGAMALFGEKYGDFVRMVTFDPDYSVELCGGTHVSATGKIGYFKIVSESSVAAGVRRIEAVTAAGAERFIQEELALLDGIRTLLKQPKNLEKSIQDMLNERNSLQKELEKSYREQVSQLKGQLKEKIEPLYAAQLIQTVISAPNADFVKQLAFELRNEVENLVLIIGATITTTDRNVRR